MNKIFKCFCSVCFLFLVSGRAEDEKAWYSSYKVNSLQKEKEAFEKKVSTLNARLLIDIKTFNSALIEKDYDTLYDYRTIEFRKIVSRKVFEKSIHSEYNAIVVIYNSPKNIEINKETATITTYYVVEASKFRYVVSTSDIWRYADDFKKWRFVSNTLPWGSQLVRESARSVGEVPPE